MSGIVQIKPCPFCGAATSAIDPHAPDCYFNLHQRLRDAPKGDLSLVPDVPAAWNRRAAPAAGTVKDAERWRAFRARDDLYDLDFTSFQDQFRGDADAVIDAAIEDRNSAGKD